MTCDPPKEFYIKNPEPRRRTRHLVDAPLRRHVEAVLVLGEALHLQELGRDRRGQEDVGLGLLESHHVVDGREGKALGCGTHKDRCQVGGVG